jgi:hypothetical protein
MARGKPPKTVQRFNDHSRPWVERRTDVVKALKQLPGDWKRDVLVSFWKEVKPILDKHYQKAEQKFRADVASLVE